PRIRVHDRVADSALATANPRRHGVHQDLPEAESLMLPRGWRDDPGGRGRQRRVDRAMFSYMHQRGFMRNDRRFVVSAIGLVVTPPLVGRALKGRDLGRRRSTYKQLCAKCHGTSGKGDGHEAATLATKPKNFCALYLDGGVFGTEALQACEAG